MIFRDLILCPCLSQVYHALDIWEPEKWTSLPSSLFEDLLSFSVFQCCEMGSWSKEDSISSVITWTLHDRSTGKVACCLGWVDFLSNSLSRFVDFFVVSTDNVEGRSGQKMPGLNLCPSPPRLIFLPRLHQQPCTFNYIKNTVYISRTNWPI